jgi:type VI secretion system secreted protein Hcp
MPVAAYLTVKGRELGPYLGLITDAGLQGSILVHSFSHQIVSPLDPATGLAAGKNQPSSLTFVKEVDQSTPLLWTTFANNEPLTSFSLRFWPPADPAAAAPATQPFYTIRLTNAVIASMKRTMADNSDPASAVLPMLEQITFTYQQIEWIWTEGEVTAQAPWQSIG